MDCFYSMAVKKEFPINIHDIVNQIAHFNISRYTAMPSIRCSVRPLTLDH